MYSETENKKLHNRFLDDKNRVQEKAYRETLSLYEDFLEKRSLVEGGLLLPVRDLQKLASEIAYKCSVVSQYVSSSQNLSGVVKYDMTIDDTQIGEDPGIWFLSTSFLPSSPGSFFTVNYMSYSPEDMQGIDLDIVLVPLTPSEENEERTISIGSSDMLKTASDVTFVVRPGKLYPEDPEDPYVPTQYNEMKLNLRSGIEIKRSDSIKANFSV